jgi:hypothetical protein
MEDSQEITSGVSEREEEIAILAANEDGREQPQHMEKGSQGKKKAKATLNLSPLSDFRGTCQTSESVLISRMHSLKSYGHFA